MTAPVARLTARLAILAAAFAALATSAEAGGCGAECYRHVRTPPIYDTVSERVQVRAEQTYYRHVPAIYETVSEQVLISPGGRVWQTQRNHYGELTGCWVHVPPQYSERHRRVLVQPPQSIPETIPAEYASIHRRVLVQPARSGWVPVHYSRGGYDPGVGIGSIPDAIGVTGASSADIGVGLGFSRGSIYDGY